MYYNVIYFLVCSMFAAALVNEYLKGPLNNDLLTLIGFSLLLVYQLNKRWITGACFIGVLVVLNATTLILKWRSRRSHHAA